MTDTVRFRREQLLKILHQDAVVSIRELSQSLEVSQPTIRRDLNVLQEEGLVERIHGGARIRQPVAREMDKGELPFYVRHETAIAEKKAIARAALQFVEADHVIMLDASTTGLYLAKALPDDLSITVITHSAYLPIELANKPKIQTISTGGILHQGSLCYLGLESENTIRQFHAHRAFFGTKGLTIQEGCTDARLPEVHLKTVMVQKVHELIILADHRKLGNVALASFAPISRISVLVTDEKADSERVQAIRAQGVEVVLAPLATNNQ